MKKQFAITNISFALRAKNFINVHATEAEN